MTTLSEKYGRAAVIAAELQGEYNSPISSWKNAVEIVFPEDNPSLIDKPCPRCAYLGLCEEGLVIGVPPGEYLKKSSQKLNKEYAVKAVFELRKNPNLTEKELWKRVAPKDKTSNNQMGVVIALWKKGLIIKR